MRKITSLLLAIFVLTLSLGSYAAASEVQKVKCVKSSSMKYICKGDFPTEVDEDTFYTEDSDGKTFYMLASVPVLTEWNEATLRLSCGSSMLLGWTRDETNIVFKNSVEKVILVYFASQDSWCEDEEGNWTQECPVELRRTGSFRVIIDDVKPYIP